MTTQMLELAIETEGLIRILRDGESSPETRALLKKKCQKLAELAAALPSEEESSKNSENSENSEIKEEEASAALDALETEATETAAPEPDTTPTPEADDIFILEGDDDILAESAPEKAIADTDGEKPAEPRATENTAEKKAGSGRKGLKSLFSLNDRYLYARELFGGNMKMFDATLDFIDGVEYYSDIEDYFYNELEWEPENVTTATFLDTLRPHFKE